MGSGCYIETITGIRTMLSFCIIARCIFEEFIENKKIVKNIIWYIIAGLIHSVGLVLLLIRILYLIIERKNKRKSLNILKFFIVGIILISILIIGRVYFSTMFDKAIAYITKGTFSYIWEYIIGIIILIFIMEILHFYKKYIKCIDNNLGLYNIYKFTYIINIIVIALIMEYNTFHRFILLNAILIIPLLVYELKYVFENYDKKVCKNLYNIIILFSIIILILECARGNMTSLKFFEF